MSAEALAVEENIPAPRAEETSPGPAGASTPAEFHRAIADELFHLVLGLMSRDDRTCAENDRMIHAAHASRFHYDFAGTVINQAMGDWQCARVHTLMGHADAARYHGLKYLETAESYGLGAFYLAHAHTALAGAAALLNQSEAEEHLRRARELAEHLSEEEEKTLIANEAAQVEREIRGERRPIEGACGCGA